MKKNNLLMLLLIFYSPKTDAGQKEITNHSGDLNIEIANNFSSELGRKLLCNDSSIIMRNDTSKKPIELQSVHVFRSLATKSIPGGLEHIIGSSTLEKVPSFLGEKDMIRALQLLPGISFGMEGSSELQVRGGTADQNLIMIDGVPLYNASHLFGMYSSFNPLMVNSAQLYTGGFPSQFGGKISSIVDVQTRDPDLYIPHASAEVGITTLKGIIELPIVKEKAAALIAMRRSIFDLLSLMNRSQSREYLTFYDVNALLSYHANKNNLIRISTYLEGDGFRYSTSGRDIENDGLQKVQRAVSITWNHHILRNTDGQLLTTYNHYSNLLFEQRNRQEMENSYNNQFQSSIAATGIKYLLQHDITQRLKLSGGIEYRRHNTDPTLFYGENAGLSFRQRTLARSYLSENSAFGQFSFSGSKTSFDIGVRYTVFHSDNFRQSALEPRFVVQQKLDNDLTAKLTFARMNQPIQRLLNPGLGMPLEIIFPADGFAKPQSSNIATIGISKKIVYSKTINFEVAAEAYHKSMQNLISFKDGFDTRGVIHNAVGGVYRSNTVHDMLLTDGIGWANGLELSVGGHFNKFSGWANYTLSRVRNHFTELNNAEWFDALQDRRHIFNTVLMCQINSKWSVSATWSYSAGAPVNIPLSYYRYASHRPDNSFSDTAEYAFTYGRRNSSRMIPFHKLDVGFTKSTSVFKHPSKLSFGVYNLYNRQNSSFYYLGSSQIADNLPSVVSLSVFPIMPSISLKIDFL